MGYLLAWRMAIAKDLLCHRDMGIAEVAERVGYGSASTFSTAFSRCVGQPPGRYARTALALEAAEQAARRQAVATARATHGTAELALKRLIVNGTEDPYWSANIEPVDRPTRSSPRALGAAG